MTHDHAGRLNRAAGATGETGLAGLLVTPSADLLYLTGYDPPPLERLTCLIVRPGAPPVLLVPALERPLAEDAGMGEMAEIDAWEETEDPYARVARIVGRLGEVGCSDRMWTSHLLRLQAAMPGSGFVTASGILGPLRAVKDRAEVELLARAARAADATFPRIVDEGLAGRTERHIARRLGEILVEEGHDQALFTIVAGGPGGASPHHEAGERRVRPGDPVVMDFGGRASGYCSDITRTVVVGKPDGGFTEVYEVVRAAQDAAFLAVRQGVPAEEVDREARRVIREAGYGEYFVHRTGHGIGLEEHEPPYLVEGNAEPLREGACFSIEPGIYLPGRFGVRIEDIVTVTAEGARRLNEAPRELVVAS